MHHLAIESLLIVGCTQGSSEVYAYMCWVADWSKIEWHRFRGSISCIVSIMEEVQNEIMDAGLNITAICLYIFHGHLWCFGGLWFLSTDLVYSQGEHVLRGSITLCP